MRFLIADSNIDSRNYIKAEIRAKIQGAVRAEFIEASEGKMALAELIIQKPDVSIIEMNLPDINVFEILSALKYLNKKVLLALPVIVISSHAKKNDLMNLLKFGIKDIVTKPIDIGSLIQKVEAALKHKRL